MGFSRKRCWLIGGLVVGREEATEVDGQFVLPVGAGHVERRGESVGERPDRARLELLVLRLEVVRVDALEQANEKLAHSEGTYPDVFQSYDSNPYF